MSGQGERGAHLQTLLLAAASMDMHEVIAHLLRAGGRDVLERSTDTPRSSPITLVS